MSSCLCLEKFPSLSFSSMQDGVKGDWLINALYPFIGKRHLVPRARDIGDWMQ
jgi:hypothetical protein